MGLYVLTLLLGLGLRQTLGEQVVGTYNQMLDPGRLYWWKNKWAAAPIELSRTNAGATGVSVSFNINPSTSVPSGYFEVTFPSSFTLTGISTGFGTTVNGQVVQIPASLTAGEDTTLTINQVTLPAASGPTSVFALRTRLTPNGQVIDTNLNFGSLYITPQEGKISTAAVSYTATQSSTIINRAENTLTFKFTISKNLWRHDLIKITTDPYYRLTLGANQCLSVETAGYVNNFNGTDVNAPHKLNCVATDNTSGSQVVWIYGLAVSMIDVSIKDNTFVTIQIPGFKNPDRVYTASSWTIETVRFGTKNVLESVTTPGPVPTAGTIISGTWTPTWGMSTSYLTQGLTVYMDLSFTLVNPVPVGSTVTVTTSDQTPVGAQCAILTSHGSGTLCTVSGANGGTLTITGFDALLGGTGVTIRYLLKIAASAAATNYFRVESKDGSGRFIDQSGNLGAFIVAGSASLVTIGNFLVQPQLKDGTSKNAAGGTGDATQYLAFQVKTLSPVLTAANIDIYCPMTTAMDDFQFSIPGTAAVAYNDNDDDDFTIPTNVLGSGTEAVTGTKPSITPGSMSTGMAPGKISFKPGSQLVGKNEIWFGVYTTTTELITLPRVIKSAKTAYECRIEIAETTGATPQKWIGVDQFAIDSQPFAIFTVDYFCTDTQVSGNPLKVTFLPKLIDIMASTATRTYYVEIGVPSGFTMLHGLSNGDAYPVDSNLSTGVVMTVSNVNPPSGFSFGHQVTGLGTVSVTAPSPITLYFPMSATTSTGTIGFSLQSYYTLTADKQGFKYITHSSTENTESLANTAATNNGKSVTINNNGPVNGQSMTTALSLTTQLSAAITGDTYFYIVFPAGYVFNNLRDIQSSSPSAGTSFAEKKFFSSPKPSFPFPGILVKTTTAGANISTSSTNLSVFGVVVPLGSSAGQDLTLVHTDGAGDMAAVCSQKATASLSTSTGTITTWSVSPNTINGRGPSGVDITHTITVVLPHGINTGGSITFSMSTAWEKGPGFDCRVTGINNAQCTVSATNDVTINGFMDFSSQVNVSVSVYLVHMLPPSLTNNLSTNFQLVTNTGFTTKSGAGSVIDLSASSGVNSIVLVRPYVTPGVATFDAITVIPPNAGTQNNDLYLRFYLEYDLPANSVLTVSSGYTLVSGTDLKSRCWLSPLTYTSCTSTGTEFVLSLSESYRALSMLELFIRTAVNAPSDVSTPTTTAVYAFKAKASWGSAVIIDYPTTLSPSQIITPTAKVTTLIKEGTVPITFSPKNEGEIAKYTFSFTLNVATEAADTLWLIWPDEFDPYVGMAMETYTQEPGNFYLPCASIELGSSIGCRLDHWTMVISNLLAAAAPLSVSLTVSNVFNPSSSAATANFRMMHFNANNVLVEYISTLGTIKPAATPSKLIDIREVTVVSNTLYTTTDYTFGVYISDTFTTTSELRIVFPPQYELSLQDKKDSYACSSTYIDETTATRTPQAWNSGTTCAAEGNTVALPAPTASQDFTTGQEVVVMVTAAATPQYGLVRTMGSKTWDFDVQDSSVYPLYSWWTNKFSLFIYNTAASSLQYTSKSYCAINSAYLGFMHPLRTLSVNNYTPVNKSNRIILYPGTQSDSIPISTVNSTFPLASKKIAFTPAINSKTPDGSRIKFSSVVNSFVMLFSEQVIYFKVAADISTPKGLYYISWQITETPQNGTITALYSPPVDTLIEVPSLVQGKYGFLVGSSPSISVGGSSLPIKVTITNPPCTEVTVNIGVLLIPTVTVTPASLLFSADIMEQYFTLNVDSSHDSTLFPSFQVIFNLTGVDAPAYTIPPGMLVGILPQVDQSAGTIVQLGIKSITRTSVSLAPVTDRLGVVYYLLAPKGSEFPSFETVKSLAKTFDYVSNVTTDIGRNDMETGPELGETWPGYQTRMYTEHVENFYKAGGVAMVTTSTTTPIVITGLAAGTTYQVVGYLDTLTGETDFNSRIEYFSTTEIPPCAVFSLTFQLSVAAAQIPNVANILAPLMNADPSQITDGYMNQTLGRRLQGNSTAPPPVQTVTSTTFTFTLLPNRFVNQPIPSTQVVLSSEAIATIRSSLPSKGITNYLTDYTVLSAPTGVIPIWQEPAGVTSYTNVTVAVYMKASTPGTTCCVALEDANPALLPEQVYLGYSFNWTKAVQTCTTTNVTTGDEIELRALNPDTNYFISCVATDSLPIWPTLMQYSEAFPVPFIPIHTPLNMEAEEVLTGATVVALGAALVLI